MEDCRSPLTNDDEWAFPSLETEPFMAFYKKMGWWYEV